MRRRKASDDNAIQTRYNSEKVVTTVHLNISTTAHKRGRVASWLRKDYPRSAPDRGHSYLIALCGVDYAPR
jgi:hypothetical protein